MYAQGALAVVFAAIVWSMDGLLRQGLFSVPSMLVVALEHALDTVIFAPFVVLGWKHVRAMRPREWGIMIGLSGVSGLLALFLYTKALSYVGYAPLSVVILLQKLQPFFTIACAAAVLRERLTARFFATAFVAVAAGYLVTFGWHLPTGPGDARTVVAALMAVGAAACWGSSTVFSKYLLRELPATVATGVRVAITAAMAGVMAVALGQSADVAALEGSQWLALAAIACSAGGVGLAIYYWGLRRIPASHSCIYELMWPVSAIAIDYVANGTVLSVAQLFGAVVLVGAMLSLPRGTA